MTFEIIGTINSLSDRIINAPGVVTVMSNPLYTSLLIVLVVVVVMLIIFRDAETDEPLFKMCLRAGFYIFIMLIGVVFLHNRVLMGEMTSVRRGSAIDRVFSTGSYAEPDMIPVDINVDFTQPVASPAWSGE